MAMMSLKDCNHIVSLDGYKLSRRIHMDYELVQDALKILSEPDKRRPDQAQEGRRIQKVAEGWLMINGEHYRKLMSEEMRRTRNRKAQTAYRERKRNKNAGKPLPGEVAAVAAMDNGDQAEADRIIESTLPEEQNNETTHQDRL